MMGKPNGIGQLQQLTRRKLLRNHESCRLKVIEQQVALLHSLEVCSHALVTGCGLVL